MNVSNDLKTFLFPFILFVLMFICFFALFLQDRQCFLHASWGLLVSRIGCYCKSHHVTFVCAFTRKVTSFNSVFIQQIRFILMITCVGVFFLFLNTEFPRYKYLLFQPTAHLPSKWGQDSKTLESFRVHETRDTAITLANGLQRSVADLFPSAKSDTPLMTIHSVLRLWAAT